MKQLIQKPGLAILLVGSGSIVAMIYFFHQSSAYYSVQDVHFINQTPSRQDLIWVPMEEIVKGKVIQILQDDPRLLNFIISRGYLHPPSTLPYNLKRPDHDPSMGQSQAVLNILGEMRNGFFVECGALDGETRSNTLFFEKELGWKGLLIEADPKNFEKVILKQRKAWSANACLAIKNIPHEVVFKQEFNTGRIQRSLTNIRKGYVSVQCFPFFSLLSALNITQVDYFSLDVEGAELEVLQTIPFESIFIKVLSVEFKHIKEGKSALISFMSQKGYNFVTRVTFPNNLANDFIFVHPNVTTNSTRVVKRSNRGLKSHLTWFDNK